MKLKLKYILANAFFLAAIFAFCNCVSVPVPPNNSEIPEKEEENLVTNDDNSIQCYLLIIDDKKITYFLNETDASIVLDRLVAESEVGGFSDVKLTNNIVIQSTFCDPCMISDTEQALQAIYKSDVNLSFCYTKNVLIVSDVQYQTVYENSSSYFEGETVTKTQGQMGEMEQNFKITYADGVEIDRELLSENVTKKPINKVILVGTKKSTASSGSYAWPIKGTIYITSYFGARTLNGVYDYHYGIDLRAAIGTSIYAADGGKVIYAGTMGSYGKLVKIEHDNGDVTYYAHLSSISVKVGERVYKGQLIAKSGATGNVTGPHLHFEIRKNGALTNPLLSLPSY